MLSCSPPGARGSGRDMTAVSLVRPGLRASLVLPRYARCLAVIFGALLCPRQSHMPSPQARCCMETPARCGTGERPHSRFVERAREKCTGEKTALPVVQPIVQPTAVASPVRFQQTEWTLLGSSMASSKGKPPKKTIERRHCHHRGFDPEMCVWPAKDSHGATNKTAGPSSLMDLLTSPEADPTTISLSPLGHGVGEGLEEARRQIKHPSGKRCGNRGSGSKKQLSERPKM